MCATKPYRANGGWTRPYRLQLELRDQHLHLLTRSQIDLSYTGTGLQAGNQQFKLETLLDDSSLLFERQFEDITQALRETSAMRVTLGFWPTWPVTQLYSGTLAVAGFAAAHQAWTDCMTLLQHR